ncbi:MAG: biopolymer transporter ExbD [Deltaproteobacteria bacterium]|nr:biopolymer transporter ExbD [Deltaproteobacteria bacterium]
MGRNVRKPSDRSKSSTPAVELNLIPYMDIVFSLVAFILFTSTGLVQVGVVNVNAPRYQDPLEIGMGKQDEEDPKKQLNLTVGITYKGLFIAGVGGVLGEVDAAAEGEAEAPKGPTIPLLTSDQICREALARNTPPSVSCYDTKKLTIEMIKIKNEFPQETKVIIYAQPDVPYEVLVKIMDATRDHEGRALFYDVILSPEIA